jgi:hypothetical protein
MDSATCVDCGATKQLLFVMANLGRGAFVAILCETCWHRRRYRAELERRSKKRWPTTTTER